jgi:hypothetical protein
MSDPCGDLDMRETSWRVRADPRADLAHRLSRGVGNLETVEAASLPFVAALLARLFASPHPGFAVLLISRFL